MNHQITQTPFSLTSTSLHQHQKTTSHEVLLKLVVLTDLTSQKRIFQTCKADHISQTQQHAKGQNPVDNLTHFS